MIELPSSEFDFALCVQSGQTFRFGILDFGFWISESPAAPWVGVVGGNWFAVRGEPGRYEVVSSANKAAFQSLFRLELSLDSVRAELGTSLSDKGLRVLRQSDPEEVFFTFLCTPNNNVERIGRMVAHLEAFGEPFSDLPSRRRFPTAHRIANIPEEKLRELGFGYRGRTIPNAARQLLDRGSEWLPSLKSADYPVAHRELCAIDGIGPKLADCICLFGLDFSEAVPVDTHLWQVACREFFPEWKGKSLTGLRYREIGDLFRERFGRHAGLVHQHLFFENLQRYRSERRKPPPVS